MSFIRFYTIFSGLSNMPLLSPPICIQKLNEAKFVELLIHPVQKVLAVRPAEENPRHSLRWTRLSGQGKWMSRKIGGAAFIPTLYQLFSWNVEYKYCIKGVCHRNAENSILLFRWADAEIFIPDKIHQSRTAPQCHEAGCDCVPGSLDGYGWR